MEVGVDTSGLGQWSWLYVSGGSKTTVWALPIKNNLGKSELWKIPKICPTVVAKNSSLVLLQLFYFFLRGVRNWNNSMLAGVK
jgi:hypothetical protein